MSWIIRVNADPVIEVWPKNRRTPCEIFLEDEGKTYALLTSHPYPIQVIEALGFKPATIDIRHLSGYVEGMGFQAAEITSLLLRQPLKDYSDWPPEGLDFQAAEISSILLRQILRTYDNWPPEGLDFGAAEITSITLETKLVTYTNWPAEGMDFQPAEITGISLVTP